MGKTRIIAETGAGQHGVATATACALLGLECIVYMGTEDMRRQQPNVAAHGAARRDASRRSRRAPRTLKEAVSAAIRDWVANVGDTHYIIGSCVGPAPFPALVRDLQRVIGDEARAQMLDADGPAARARDRVRRRRLQRDRHLHAVRRRRRRSQLIGVEAAGDGIETGRHGAPLTVGGPRRRPARRLLGDHAGRGRPDPRGALDLGRARLPRHRPRARASCATPAARRYEAVTDAEALDAFQRVARLEGIIPALESSHAVAWALAGRRRLATLDLICLSGRGDKDLAEALLPTLGLSVTRRPASSASPPRSPATRRARRADAVPDGRLPRPRGVAWRSARRTPTAAPTSSSSACRSPTRWPTAR